VKQLVVNAASGAGPLACGRRPRRPFDRSEKPDTFIKPGGPARTGASGLHTNVKQLVINADDFGFTRDVNQGIVEAHREGILTATTLMATGAAFDDAVRLAKQNPSLDVGCHLVLVGEPPFAPTVAQLVRDIAVARIRIYDELAAQVQRIISAGLRPSHLDTHKHTHLLPPVLSAVARISEEFGIPWVRRPFDFPLVPGGSGWAVRAVSRSFRTMSGHFERVLTRHGCRSTDHFAGFQLTGRVTPGSLVDLIRALPDGSTEFMCHPGRCTDQLRAATTRLKDSREQELRALTAPEVRAALREAQVELISYREL